jgi:hypothetical protein
MSDVLACAECKTPFPDGTTAEEAGAEYAELFPDEAAAGIPFELVCAECFSATDPDA